MHIFLQIENAERFFNTTPDTVFGLLTGALALAVVSLWVAYYKQTNGYVAKLVELNVSCVETLKDLSSNLERLRDSGITMTTDLRQEIDRTREHISTKIDSLQSHQSPKS